MNDLFIHRHESYTYYSSRPRSEAKWYILHRRLPVMKLPTNHPSEFTFDDILLLPGKSNFSLDDEDRVVSLTSVITPRLSIDIPLVSSPMPGVTETEMAIEIGKAGGLGIIHPFQSFDSQLHQVKTVKSHKVKVGVSVSNFSSDGMTHVQNLMRFGTDLISIETPHAHNTHTLKFIRSLRRRFPNINISAALVVTPDATKDLILAGADNIRVGIGGGSHCTTRLVTGVGRPQLSAVFECYKIARKHNIPIMSDTGIKYAGDIVKAIALGADSVMIGGLFAGTTECPGPVIRKNWKLYKYSWGMCTRRALEHRGLHNFMISNLKKLVKSTLRSKSGVTADFEEGIEGYVPYRGPVSNIIRLLTAGIRRSLWYQGVDSLHNMRENARIVFVSKNTVQENLPRL